MSDPLKITIVPTTGTNPLIVTYNVSISDALDNFTLNCGDGKSYTATDIPLSIISPITESDHSLMGASHTYRMIIPSSKLLTSGTSFKIKIKGGPFNNISIVERASGSNGTNTPTEITFNGTSGKLGSDEAWSDTITYTIDSTKSYLLTFDTPFSWNTYRNYTDQGYGFYYGNGSSYDQISYSYTTDFSSYGFTVFLLEMSTFVISINSFSTTHIYDTPGTYTVWAEGYTEFATHRFYEIPYGVNVSAPSVVASFTTSQVYDRPIEYHENYPYPIIPYEISTRPYGSVRADGYTVILVDVSQEEAEALFHLGLLEERFALTYVTGEYGVNYTTHTTTTATILWPVNENSLILYNAATSPYVSGSPGGHAHEAEQKISVPYTEGNIVLLWHEIIHDQYINPHAIYTESGTPIFDEESQDYADMITYLEHLNKSYLSNLLNNTALSEIDNIEFQQLYYQMLEMVKLDFNDTIIFPANEDKIIYPNKIQFINTSTGDINECYWDFGDGFHSYETNPVHTYYSPATYNVTLYASNQYQYSSATSSVTITQILTPPNAYFIPARLDIINPTLPYNVTFTNLSTPTFGCTYNWTVDGGNVSTSSDPTISFTTHGVYDIGLTVTNSLGSSSRVYNDAIRLTRKSRTMNEVVGGADTFSTFGVQVFLEYATGTDLPIVYATILPEGVYFIQREIPDVPGIDEWGVRHLYSTINEWGVKIFNTINSWGHKILHNSSSVDRTPLKCIDVEIFEETVIVSDDHQFDEDPS